MVKINFVKSSCVTTPVTADSWFFFLWSVNLVNFIIICTNLMATMTRFLFLNYLLISLLQHKLLSIFAHKSSSVKCVFLYLFRRDYDCHPVCCPGRCQCCHLDSCSQPMSHFLPLWFLQNRRCCKMYGCSIDVDIVIVVIFYDVCTWDQVMCYDFVYVGGCRGSSDFIPCFHS